jgi:hypothetical protein
MLMTSFSPIMSLTASSCCIAFAATSGASSSRTVVAMNQGRQAEKTVRDVSRAARRICEKFHKRLFSGGIGGAPAGI